MSNKTDLQALNAKYESLIETLRGKAVGGGSGGSVETCTVTIMGNSASFTCVQLENGVFDTGNSAVAAGEQTEVVANSMLYLDNVSIEDIIDVSSIDGESCIQDTGLISQFVPIYIGKTDTTITLSNPFPWG